jgi:hypothetical protein
MDDYVGFLAVRGAKAFSSFKIKRLDFSVNMAQIIIVPIMCVT